MKFSNSINLEKLPSRNDFLATARAYKVVAVGLVLQMRIRKGVYSLSRVGYTASCKVGNAVKRNRSRRRLRAIVNDVLVRRAQPGCDYVLIARAATAKRTYSNLLNDLASALDRMEKIVMKSKNDNIA
ncbi:Ribonuclease P protein component [Candidatus Endolissoclinum faulkneri L5]|uniref:Ribonuclease P protein component n=1 Tax=Candidatus Endolissoclinum faulkneri L5 TaxID=1401328 RepID=V9TTV9_9PROT|nr:ribonuclease P protein component [Candidatus Endolissoclinum faulkneri]AHC73602.1 Ribonuclease P protein component [Candidatus Endolissoclinum faulkneri L5]